MVAGRTRGILIGVAPRIGRYAVLQIGPLPTPGERGLGRAFDEQLQALLLAWVPPDVQTHRFDRSPKHPYLCLGGLYACPISLAEQARAHQTHDQTNDHQDHYHFE